MHVYVYVYAHLYVYVYVYVCVCICAPAGLATASLAVAPSAAYACEEVELAEAAETSRFCAAAARAALNICAVLNQVVAAQVDIESKS
jgi:hypothetical protein